MVATRTARKKNYESATPIGKVTREAKPIGMVDKTATSTAAVKRATAPSARATRTEALTGKSRESMPMAKMKKAAAIGATRMATSVLSDVDVNKVKSMHSSMNKLKKEYGGTTTSLGGEVGKKQNLAKSYAEHRSTKKKVGKSY